MALLRKLFGSPARADPAAQGAAVAYANPTGQAPASGSEDGEPSRILVAANSLNVAGRHGEALALVAEGLASMPANPELLFARASILFDWGRYRESRDGCLRADAAGMRGVALQLQLGWAHYHSGNAAAAEAPMRRAAALEPDSRRTRTALAMVLFALGRFGDAEAAMKRVLELCPGDFECLWVLGNCKMGQGDLVAAEDYFRLAIAADPERAIGWKDLGAALNAQDGRREAIEASATSVQLDSKHGELSDNFINLAIELADNDRLTEALALHEEMLPGLPYTYGYLAYAQALLTAGRLAEGWHHYEFRFLSKAHFPVRQTFGRPAWSGQNLQGKSILLLAEQGAGDAIQFIRYARRLKTLGATVLLRVTDGFEEFARGFPGVDEVLDRDMTGAEFDYYLYIGSLPYAFGTDLASIPVENAYLRADPVREARWASRVGPNGNLKIGLVWAGNPSHPRDRHRSMPLATLAPLGKLGGAQFFALQKGPREDEAKTSPPGLSLVNLGPELVDFRDTAAVISQLDLVLCVDTAVAHLAGALGKPVWLMLPKAADWRWLKEREDSPWYPTMRLFRQRDHGDWGDVIERVAVALRDRLTGEVAVPAPALPGAAPVPGADATAPSIGSAGHRPGFSAVAETRYGIMQYLPDEPLVGDSLRWYGELLQPQLDLLAPMVRPGATVMEVGSGVGAHALTLAAAIGEAGHLMLYESQPVPRQLLRQNLAANRVGNVTLMRRMLAGTSLTESVGNAGNLVGRPATTVSPTETVDDLHLDRLDLIKVNAGMIAMDVLAGAAATLWRLRPSLFIAVPDDGKLTEVAMRLQEFGHRCWRMETAWFNPQNFNRRDDDIFAGRKFLALLAVPEESEVDVAQSGCVEL
jgi:tetratricopeptide (TPR) repeat protein